jgi:5-methylcytosine-specific restriction endonuclease McrA
MTNRSRLVTHCYPKSRARLYQPSYESYGSYKDHLRDEFDFRCGYCLNREIWQDAFSHAIDHWLPQNAHPDLEADYENLVYSCGPCNNFKRALLLGLKPLQDPLEEHVAFDEDAVAVGLTRKGTELVRILRLNDDKRLGFRQHILELWKLAEQKNPALILGMPSHSQLPDLTKKKPYQATTENCYFKMCEKGNLPKTFISERPSQAAPGSV